MPFEKLKSRNKIVLKKDSPRLAMGMALLADWTLKSGPVHPDMFITEDAWEVTAKKTDVPESEAGDAEAAVSTQPPSSA